MKAIKTIAAIALITTLAAANAQAWGKKEQGILIGAGAALMLPHLLNPNTYTYKEPVRYVEQPVQYVYQTRYAEPKVIYVEKDDGRFSHRRAKRHNYINNRGAGDKVIIEHSDGSRTIVYR
jgi:hypothetical protein